MAADRARMVFFLRGVEFRKKTGEVSLALKGGGSV